MEQEEFEREEVTDWLLTLSACLRTDKIPANLRVAFLDLINAI